MLANNVIAPVRLIIVTAAVALTGCAQSTATDGSLASAPQAAAAARSSSAPPPPTTRTAMTVQQARGECWMKVEGDRRAPHDLDRRLKLVEACVGEKMNGAARQP
jgi:hypothetical protein